MRTRVVITGIGGICGLGTDAASIWNDMKAGRPAIGQVVGADLHQLKVQVGSEIKVLPEHGLERRRLVTMDRFSLLAVIAAKEAMQQSGLTVGAENTYRIGATIGVGVCGWETIEDNYRALLLQGKNRADIFSVPKAMPGAAAGQVSMQFGLRGPVFGVTSACSCKRAISSGESFLYRTTCFFIVVIQFRNVQRGGLMRPWAVPGRWRRA